MAEYVDSRDRHHVRYGAPSMGKWIAIGAVALGALIVIGWGVSAYNSLVALDQSVDAQWAQVENVYQRRADLVPNLVRTVQGAARFERETLREVVEARSRVAGVTAQTAGAGARPSDDPQALARYQAAQDQLSSALSRLLVVVERYPQLGATAAFRDLQSQLEGTENRIAVERMRFNDRARDFNTKRSSFPTNLIAGVFGGQFQPKAYFHATRGAERAPTVEF